MRPPITNHQDYWLTKNRTIPDMEDAKARGLLKGPEVNSVTGAKIAGELYALEEFKCVVKDYEEKHPLYVSGKTKPVNYK